MDEEKKTLKDLFEEIPKVVLTLTYEESDLLCSVLCKFTGNMVPRRDRYVFWKLVTDADIQMHRIARCTAEMEEGVCFLKEHVDEFKSNFVEEIKKDPNKLSL